MSTRRQSEIYEPHEGVRNLAKLHPNALGYATGTTSRSELPGHEKVHEKDSTPVATHTIGELDVPKY